MKVLFFILFFQSIVSQNTVEVLYKTSFNGDFLSKENKESKESIFQKNFFNGIESKISTLHFQLIVSENKSLLNQFLKWKKKVKPLARKWQKLLPNLIINTTLI